VSPAVNPWEIAAVVLAIAYLVLAIRENIWCWAAGMASSAIYLMLLARSSLYMESALQGFYVAVSAYGWRRWGRRPAADLRIRTWRARQHATAIAAVTGAAAVTGWLLATRTAAALPYLDAFIAWGSIVATWMVARKILENWLYWFVLDSLAVYVYVQRELWLTAGLFVLYLVLIVAGFRAWRRRLPVPAS
jgi:nicotinamide mononucleotide transporter